ncbi:hypothetical protein ACFY9N_11565 [Microbacterium sp. NPDC008134]|uniref:hypothetical protein n=1 Tax=Microbacterium sp. NPDC008134 TaxID=3364183 RepID=UPI0036E03889
MTGIENTSATDPLILFAEALGNPGGFVEAQEARGQAQVVASEQLPTEADWDALTALGFTKGDPVPGDDLFVYATIPDGWTKEPTDHSMYSVIKDERGVERVSIGYKAAYYDRWANMHVKYVGSDIALHLVYGDGDIVKPPLWDVLTESERSEAVARAKSHLQERAEFIEQYGKGEDDYYANQLRRAESTVALLESL